MRFQFERLLFSFALFIARILPRNLFLAFGRSFGSLAYLLDRRHRTIAMENFRMAFPGTEKSASAVIRSCYRHFGAYLFDMLKLIAKLDEQRLLDYEVEGLHHLEAAYARGKGVICFTGHFGVWEIMALAQAMRGFSLGLIARTLDNPYLEKLLRNFRTATGNFVIDKKEGFRPALKALKEGKGIAILIDQNITTEDRIFVNFFGKSASTTPALALLKLKTDAALIPVYSFPLPGNRYKFHYGAPLQVSINGDRRLDVLNITQECTSVIEQFIRNHPEYWLWMHRRWKTLPSAEDTTDRLPVQQAQSKQVIS
jgi:KDO2-lipid IV(A) lauroyltransferase